MEKKCSFRWRTDMIDNLIDHLFECKICMSYKNMDFDADKPFQYKCYDMKLHWNLKRKMSHCLVLLCLSYCLIILIIFQVNKKWSKSSFNFPEVALQWTVKEITNHLCKRAASFHIDVRSCLVGKPAYRDHINKPLISFFKSENILLTCKSDFAFVNPILFCLKRSDPCKFDCNMGLLLGDTKEELFKCTESDVSVFYCEKITKAACPLHYMIIKEEGLL